MNDYNHEVNYKQLLGQLGTWLVIAAVIILLAGCGASCPENAGNCASSGSMNVCQGGGELSFPCKGSGGCTSDSSGVTCDITGNADGDPCPTIHEGSGNCAADGVSLLQCTGGRWHKMSCPSVCIVTLVGRVTCV